MIDHNQKNIKTNNAIHNMKNVDTFGVFDLNREIKKTAKKMLNGKKILQN